MGWHAGHWGALAAAVLLTTGCYEGPEMGMSGSGMASVGEDDDEVMTGPETTGEIECIPGNETCICLNGGCAGSLHCVNDECVPGPVIDENDFEDRYVIGGVRVPIEIDIEADSFSWAQTGGPAADAIQGETDLTLLVDVPPDANAGARMVFTLTAVRNTIEEQYQVGINIMAADFSNLLNMINDPEQAGTVEGLDIRDFEAWVISTEGFVSRFNPEGGFISRIDIPGAPYGGYFGELPNGDNGIDVMYVANQMTETVEAIVLNSGEIRMVTNQMTSGGALGPVDFVLPYGDDDDGELFFTNREGGQIFHYYFDNEAETWNTVEFAADLGTNPNALAEGPEPGYLYVGTVGRVWRVPILEDGTAGAAEVYLNLGAQDDLTLEVDGIAFDETATMYVGTPGAQTLTMARYRANGETEVVRSFTGVGGQISSFVNVQFGNGDFGGGNLYWTNLDTGAVGRLPVGLGGL